MPLLTAKNRKDRLAALPHLRALDWKKVLACDEVPLHVITKPNPQNDRVWAHQRPSGGKPVPKMPRKVFQALMGSWYHGCSKLAFYDDSLSADKYQLMLKSTLAPIAQQHELLLLHDSASAHTEQSTKDVIKAEGKKRFSTLIGLATAQISMSLRTSTVC